MKTFFFWVFSLATLLFWGFGIVDMGLTLSGNEAYLKDFPPQMVTWIQNFPLWRKVIWGLSVALGVFGSLMLVLRRPMAPWLLWAAWALMMTGFVGHDLMMAQGVEYYGAVGLISSGVLIFLAFLFAWHASAAAKSGRFRR